MHLNGKNKTYSGQENLQNPNLTKQEIITLILK